MDEETAEQTTTEQAGQESAGSIPGAFFDYAAEPVRDPAGDSDPVPAEDQADGDATASIQALDPAGQDDAALTGIDTPALTPEEQFVQAVQSNPAILAMVEQQLRDQQIQQELYAERQRLEEAGHDEAQIEYALGLRKWQLDLQAQQEQINRSMLSSRIEALTTQYPSVDRTVLETVAASVPPEQLEGIAKTIHTRNAAMIAQERAKYAAEKAKDGSSFVPGTGSGSPAGITRPAPPSANAPWSVLLGVRK